MNMIDDGVIEIDVSSASGEGKPHFLSQGSWLDAGSRPGDKAGTVYGKQSKKRVATWQHADADSSNKKKAPNQQTQKVDEQSWTKRGGYGYNGGTGGGKRQGYEFETHPNRYVNQGQQVPGTVWFSQGKGNGRQKDHWTVQYRGGWNQVAAGLQALPFHPMNKGGKGKGGKGGF